MSIRGIDTQIMITRATDFVREANSVQRQPEIAQDHLAAQAKIESTQDQSRVNATTESEMENIRTDVDEDGSNASGEEQSNRKKQNEDPEDVPVDLRVAPALHDQLIDITV